MGAFSTIASGFDGLVNGNHATDGGVLANTGQILQGLGQVGTGVATMGGATPGVTPSVVPSTTTATSTTGLKPIGTPTPIATPAAPVANASIGQPVAIAGPSNTVGGNPPAGVTTPTTSGTVPSTVAPTTPIGSAGFDSLYGNDTGGAVTNLLNSETAGTANSTAQSIIAANQPNVDQGRATLNTGLASAGISPSSSVSAIENANYEGQVQQQNLSELAQTNLTEQQMQQNLLESLLPGQQKRETDSSGWNIFGDVASGLGDIGSLLL